MKILSNDTPQTEQNSVMHVPPKARGPQEFSMGESTELYTAEKQSLYPRNKESASCIKMPTYRPQEQAIEKQSTGNEQEEKQPLYPRNKESASCIKTSTYRPQEQAFEEGRTVNEHVEKQSLYPRNSDFSDSASSIKAPTYRPQKLAFKEGSTVNEHVQKQPLYPRNSDFSDSASSIKAPTYRPQELAFEVRSTVNEHVEEQNLYPRINDSASNTEKSTIRPIRHRKTGQNGSIATSYLMSSLVALVMISQVMAVSATDCAVMHEISSTFTATENGCCQQEGIVCDGDNRVTSMYVNNSFNLL
jgi:hypothetical protein